MAGGVFPAYIKLEHQRDGSAKSSFLAEVDNLLGTAERRFKEFSGEAQRQLDAALSVSRNSSGSLDLGVDQLRAAAEAQKARAIAAREVAQATALAAREEGDYSQQARLAVAATQALAIEEERAASQALAHARAAEQVQERLNRQASATDAVVLATRRGTDASGAVTNSVRAHRVAMVQLGQQMQDMVIQWQMGTQAVTIFAQQVPQAAFALSGMEGRVGAVARFLSGPWGAAMVLGIAALGPLVTKLFEAGDAADDTKKKTMTLADALKQYASATDEARKAIEEYNEAQDRERDNADYMIKVNLASAEAKLKDAQATREQLAALLEKRAADLAPANQPIFTDPTAAEGYQSGLSFQLRQTLNAIGANKTKIDELGQLTRNLRIQDARREAEAAVDPIKAINNQYDDMRDKAIAAAAGNDALSKSLAGLLEGYERQRKVALDAAREAQRSGRNPYGGSAEIAQFGAPIEGARISSGYGLRRAPTRGASTNHLGIDYAAPLGTPVLAAMDGIVKFAAMVNGYGNQIRLTHGAGTETRYAHLSGFNVRDGQAVSKGDVIGYVGKTGTATGTHLHYEVLVNGKKVDPRKGEFPVDPSKVAEASQKAADELQRFGERAAESVLRINERFDEQPRLIDQAAQATRHLDDIIREASERKPIGWEQIVDDAEAAKLVIEDALVRPFRELEEDSKRRIQIQELLTTGREAEATALQQIWQLEERLGPLTEERKRQILAIAIAEEKANEALEVRRQQIGEYLSATRSIRGELEALFSGRSVDFGQIFRDLQAKVTVEKLFGPALRDLEKWVSNEGRIDRAVDKMAEETTRAGNEAGNFADALVAATSRINSAASASTPLSGGGFSGGMSDGDWAKFTDAFDRAFKRQIAANDNSLGSFDPVTGEITVSRNRGSAGGPPIIDLPPDTVGGISFTTYSEMVANVMTKPLVDAIAQISPSLAAKLGPMMNGALGGFLTGGIPGGIFGLLKEIPGIGKGAEKIFGQGLEGAQTGTMVAGLGNALGLKMSSTGSQIGGALGGALFGPLGSIVGAIGGGLFGKLFHSAKWGYAQVSNTGVRTGGNNGDMGSAASGGGDAVSSAIQRIADTLGATIGNYMVSIGVTDGKWRYSTTGRTGELKSKYGDVVQTGTGDAGYAAAVKGAIADAIRDGAIQGVRAGTQVLLRAGKDIEAQLQKAVDFENVFKRLKAYDDPVGAALDVLDLEFNRLKKIFHEAAASTEEFAELERLYGLERAKVVKQAMEQLTASLQGLYDDLTIGDNGLSLSDRRAAALAKYNPLKERVQAGDVTAYDDFTDAARALLDITREMYGSQSNYFALFDEVKAITESRISNANTVANQSANRDSPFTPQNNPATPVISAELMAQIQALGFQINGQLSAINQNLGAIIAQGLQSGALQPRGIVGLINAAKYRAEAYF